MGLGLGVLAFFLDRNFDARFEQWVRWEGFSASRMSFHFTPLCFHISGHRCPFLGWTRNYWMIRTIFEEFSLVISVAYDGSHFYSC